jgi:hypothetical protein
LQHLVGRDATARFRVMETMKREDSIDEVAEALEVSKSGFYAHLRKSQRLRRRGDQRLRVLIRSSFEQSRATYGCLRIRWDLLLVFPRKSRRVGRRGILVSLDGDFGFESMS